MMSIPTIAHMINTWQKKIDRIDIELIIGFILHKDRAFILAHDDMILSPEAHMHILQALSQRSLGMPLAYITQKKEFYGRSFHITSDTLVPRPETELYIPTIMQLPDAILHNALVVDIGTGSGIIAITLAKEFLRNDPKRVPSLIATDISHKALSIAKHNAHMHHVDRKIRFFHSNLLRNKRLRAHMSFSRHTHIIIAANLPYVDNAQKEILCAKKESRALYYEPHTALWSDDRGLYHYKKLTRQILFMKKTMPNKKFLLFYEIVPGQEELLTTFLSKYTNAKGQTSTFPDLSHQPRIFSLHI